jgi:DNA-binding IscR family transcriptional regulator
MIPLSPQSNAAVAIVSRLCEAHARDEEANVSELLTLSGVDEKATWQVLAELARAEVIMEGFDAGGYRVAREPGSITLLDVATPFELLLQDDCRRITQAMRPVVRDYFQAITFAACATSCPSESQSEEPGNCPRSLLAATSDQPESADPAPDASRAAR